MAGGPCDYCVSPSPSPNIWVLGIFRLGQTLGSGLGECWDRELRLGQTLGSGLGKCLDGELRLGQTLRSGLGECWDGELRLGLGLDKNLDLRLRTNVLVN